jgi:hypothetical protein
MVSGGFASAVPGGHVPDWSVPRGVESAVQGRSAARRKEDVMELPEYVTVEEVKKVCHELGIRDWTGLEEPAVLLEEAEVILSEVNVEQMKIAPDDFRQGLEVELEHGLRFEDANVTNNHPILTGKIVLAHLKETLDYYKRIDVAEIEGDLLKAIVAKDLGKIRAKYEKLMEAQILLSQTAAEQVRGALPPSGR